MKKGKTKNKQNGQSVVTLIIFITMAVTIMSAAVAVAVSNTQNQEKGLHSVIISALAESAAEDALLHLLRNPSWSGGSTQIQGETCAVTITGNQEKIVTISVFSQGINKTLEINAQFINNVLTVDSWKEKI